MSAGGKIHVIDTSIELSNSEYRWGTALVEGSHSLSHHYGGGTSPSSRMYRVRHAPDPSEPRTAVGFVEYRSRVAVTMEAFSEVL